MVKLLTTKSPDGVRAFLLPRVLGNGIAIAPAAREEVKEVVRSQDLEKGILVIPTCDFDGSTRGRMRDEEHLPACVPIGEIHEKLPPRRVHPPSRWLRCLRPCRADFGSARFSKEPPRPNEWTSEARNCCPRTSRPCGRQLRVQTVDGERWLARHIVCFWCARGARAPARCSGLPRLGCPWVAVGLLFFRWEVKKSG